MKLKKGTPLCGLVLGGVLTLAGALVMLIGFWKTPILFLLFGLGYFLGTVENKKEFIKTTANRLIPDREVKVIDLKSELIKEQELSQAAGEKAGKVSNLSARATCGTLIILLLSKSATVRSDAVS